MTLLSAHDPAPFTVDHADGVSEFVIVVDHAGREIPRSLRRLGLSDSELDRHIAWDIGIAATSRELANRLDAFVIMQTYSRLVIDCNRLPRSPQSIVTLSERTTIPHNVNLAETAIDQRVTEIFEPYHHRIRDELDRRIDAGRRTILIAMHSFTPVYLGQPRSWHAGVLYNQDSRLARHVLASLSADPDLVVGDNKPYAASAATDYALVVHGERRRLPCVELEIRQDLIADTIGQQRWAERIHHVLENARTSMFPT